MAIKKLVATQKAGISRSMGPNVRQVIPSAIDNIDPFVFLDHFGPFPKMPNAQGVPPHPHAGIATITYLFEGSNRHQDSYGNEAMVKAGDLAWMQAGKGIVHAEGMNENRQTPETVHGLQIWISLPAKDKFAEPAFYHYESEQLPHFQQNEIYIKVISGELLGHISPVKSLSPAYIFEVKMPANQTLTLPLTEGNTCGVYAIAGNAYSEERKLIPTSMTKFERAGDTLFLETKEDESHFVILGGTPLDEPIVAYASFVMNSSEQIRQVIANYQMGKMGELKV